MCIVDLPGNRTDFVAKLGTTVVFNLELRIVLGHSKAG